MLYEGLNKNQLELMRCIEDNLNDEVKRLVREEGVNPDFTTGNMINSPIYLSIHKGNYELTQWFLEEGGVKPTSKILEWAGICSNPSLCNLILNKMNLK